MTPNHGYRGGVVVDLDAQKQLRTRVYGMEGMLAATADFLQIGGRMNRTTRSSIVADLRACEGLLNELRTSVLAASPSPVEGPTE